MPFLVELAPRKDAPSRLAPDVGLVEGGAAILEGADLNSLLLPLLLLLL